MRTAKLAWVLGIVLTVGALPACAANESAGDEYLAGAPELSALQLGVTDDPTSEGLATDDDSVDATERLSDGLAEASAALATQVAPELADCRAAVRDLNEALRSFLQPIVALVRDTEPDSTAANTKIWGPVTRGATDYRFVMRRGAARRFGWLLQARPSASTEPFSAVAAGEITVGYAVRRGVGSVGIDLETLGKLDPTVAARGTLLASFAHGPNGSMVAYRLQDFTPDPTQKGAIDAIVQGVHLKAGFNRLRLAYYGNVPGTATDAQEFVLARVRHMRGIGGRADERATGGDIADGQVWVVNECWDSDLKSVYRDVNDCPADGIGSANCALVSSTGDASACAPDVADSELPPADPNAVMSDPQSPEGDVTPPASMPDGTPPNGD